MHILVHSVSLHDVVFSDERQGGLKARPTYKAFERVTMAVMQHLLMEAAAIDRDELLMCLAGDTGSLPVGLRLPVPLPLSLSDLQFPDGGPPASANSSYTVTALYFPHVSVLITRWLRSLPTRRSASPTTAGAAAAAAAPPPSRICYLLSSAGAADPSGMTSADTRHAAMLTARFVRAAFRDVVLRAINGEDTCFDSAVATLKQHLVPHIDAARRALVSEHGEGWQQHFRLALTMAGGDPSRVAAEMAALRRFKPSYLQVTNTKWWFHDDLGLAYRSVHLFSFDAIEGNPPQPLASVTDEDVQLVAAEMMRHRDAFVAAMRGCGNGASGGSGNLGPGASPIVSLGLMSPTINPTTPGIATAAAAAAATPSAAASSSAAPGSNFELSSFWLRKTRQPVLAVLLCRKQGSKTHTLHRAINLEVSMPTGSLCSERAVISAALASDPSLRRQDLKAIAVLSLPKLQHPDAKVAAAYEVAGVGTESHLFWHPQATKPVPAAVRASTPTPTPMPGPRATGSPPPAHPHSHGQGHGHGHSHAQPYAASAAAFLPRSGSGGTSSFTAPTAAVTALSSATSTASLGSSTGGGSGSGVGRRDSELMPPPPPSAPRLTPLRARSCSITSTTSSVEGGSGLSGRDSVSSLRDGTDNDGNSAFGVDHDAHMSSAGGGASGGSGGGGSGYKRPRHEVQWGGSDSGSGSLTPVTGLLWPTNGSGSGSGSGDGSAAASAPGGSGGSVGSGSAAAAPAAKRPRFGKPDAPPPPLSSERSHVPAHAHGGIASGSGSAAGGSGGGSGGQVAPPATPLGSPPPPPASLAALNPLAPCGACTEWLKKVAEVNPDFRVVMFTDVTCSNVIVKHV